MARLRIWVEREDGRAEPSDFLRTGLPGPGILILIATFMSAQRKSPTLNDRRGNGSFRYFRCRSGDVLNILAL